MRTLYQAITAHTPQASAIIQHLEAVDIKGWKDLTKVKLNDFRDHCISHLSTSSAKTYFACLMAAISRYEDEVEFCKEYRDILKVRTTTPVKTFLNSKELEQLERVEISSPQEQYVLDEFMIGAYTGMRVSDAMQITEDNVANGFISYVSIKTGVHSIIPLKPGILERIKRVQTNEITISAMGYSKAIKRLCKRAGINARVNIYKADKTIKGEKWEFVSSHTARISFCTNLAILGVPLLDIAKLAGHKDIKMTLRYIVPTKVVLSDAALAYFQ